VRHQFKLFWRIGFIEADMPDKPEPELRRCSFCFYLMLGAALLVSIKCFSLLSPILLSFLLVLLVSFALNPVVSRMMAWTSGRKVATGLVVAAFVLVIGLTGWAFTVPLKGATEKIVQSLPGCWERVQNTLSSLSQPAGQTEAKPAAKVTAAIPPSPPPAGGPAATPQTNAPAPPEAAKDSGFGLGQMLQGMAGGFKAMALNTSQIMVVFATVFFGVTFTLMNPRPVFGAIFSIIPGRHHEQTLIILQKIGKFVPTWACATLLAMLTVGSLVFLLMWPFFGFMDALVLGLIAGVFEAVPYLGPLLSAVPALMFTLGQGGMTPLWVLLLYLAVQFLENNVISPLIMARGMKLHPVAVIFSMLLCVEIFGILGVLIAAPMVAIVEILHGELYRKRFLPAVTDADLDRLARNSLREKPSATK
jgi:predicted PurR-regulated permease PerM